MLIKLQKRSVLLEFKNVIEALLIREVKTRFGKYNFGFFWLLLEPLTNVIVLGLILGPVIGRSTREIPYAIFLLCGFLLLKAFRDPVKSSLTAIAANQGLMIFRQVEPIDLFLSRFIFAILSILFSFFTFYVLGLWFGLSLSYSHLIEVIYCILCTWLIGSGFGLFIGIKAMKFKELEKIVGFILYPLMFISCVLFPLSLIPAQYQHIFLYNPLVHTIEYLRQSLFPSDYLVPQVNLYYPSLWALASLSLGFVTYHNNYHFLKQR